MKKGKTDMKKNLFYIMLTVACMGFAFTSCSEEPLNPESVIIDSNAADNPTPFDRWLQANFVEPYNIQFAYRYENKETDHNYYTVPARYEEAIILAHLIKFICIEAYDEVAGVAFTRRYFPKMIYCIGEYEYNNNGTAIMGTAETGKKIYMMGTNYVSSFLDSPAELNDRFLKTIHH